MLSLQDSAEEQAFKVNSSTLMSLMLEGEDSMRLQFDKLTELHPRQHELELALELLIHVQVI